ncbi:bone morphogenetic protein 1-like isoform X1 [Daphnia pulicaria]|uniref:bone morphogenetic protein 1-like isoform X1 n=1 Tax=Daphnia pulicaria TaxID=35523 RepID=UPI001EEA0808|nr:bone morphogenetic protein 1-like isoform X1 [Daphnia pulicaria]
MKVSSEYLSKIRVRFKPCRQLIRPASLTTTTTATATTTTRLRLMTALLLILLLPRSLSAQGYDVFIDLEEEGTSLDDTKISVSTTNDGLKCDRTFVSTNEGSRNGTFASPLLENQEGHVRQCLFTFVAAPGERVHLTFNMFNLRGTPPDGSTAGHTAMCSHEYIDLYTEIPDSEPVDLIHSPFGGRYCGQIPPRRRVSLYRTAVLGFFTDKNSTTTDDLLFQGTYLFFKDDQFQVGTPVPRTTCNFTIDGLVKRQGDIMTPTYPGVYPKDMTCAYKFVGKKGQRIRLEFRDFDTFYGGPHCPLDAVDVYDGLDAKAPLIGRYCGQQRNVVIFSTEHHLLVTFTTLKRTADSQNRGFLAKFEFSETFVKLDFISREDSKHDRGSECDQTILSRKGSSAVVYSPNYPFPYSPGIVCKYNVYGLQDEQHFERIRLDFEKFDIPSADNTCADGFLRIYLKGQDISVTYLYEKHDHELCSNNVSSPYWSEGQRLSMIFSSGQSQGSGFKARFLFATEYSIPGTPSPLGGCNFTYMSSSKKRGDFNSPRHPARYPSNLTCTYNFILAGSNENVRLYFDQFKVRANDTTVFYGSYCQEDWVEIYNVFYGGREVLLGRYCGDSFPGPVESDPGSIGLKVILHTDEEGVFNGFKGRYTFDENDSINRDCGSNLSVPGAASGVFTSPKYPEKYDRSSGLLSCSWQIHSARDHRILLHFESFSIEGEMETRGCAAAAVRVWKRLDEPPVEICGENLKAEHETFMSEGNVMKITFTTADKVAGGRGFRAVWTEVKTPALVGGYDCDEGGQYFRCANNTFCIAKQLECDGNPNCGLNDGSDEGEHCGGVRYQPALNTLPVSSFSRSQWVSPPQTNSRNEIPMCRYGGRRRIFSGAPDVDTGRLCFDSAHDFVYRVPSKAAAEAAQHQLRAAAVRTAAAVRHHVVASVDVAPVRHPVAAAAGSTLHESASALDRRRR